MKRAAAVCLLALCLPALAAEPKPWPQKGDTVFVPGELAGQFLTEMTLTGEMHNVTVPACAPLQVSFAPKPDKITVVDIARNAYFPLCGEWKGWVTQIAAECKKAVASAPLTFQKKRKCYSALPSE
jgi:hypothetical protein